MNDLGAIIKEYRILRGFKQSQVARGLNIKQASISQFEGNKRKPSKETLQKIWVLLQIPINYQVEREAEIEVLNKTVGLLINREILAVSDFAKFLLKKRWDTNKTFQGIKI